MKWIRIEAVMQKYIYAAQRDVFRIFDIFWWPTFQLFVWGLFSIFLSQTNSTGINLVSVLLGAVILWTFFDRASKDISLAMIDELWNRNFVNIFSTPLTLMEYLIGVTIVATIKLLISCLFMFVLARILYGFDIGTIGFYLIPVSVGLTIFGWSISLVVQSLIMRYGHTVEVAIWAASTLIQPLSCVFYPLSVLPLWAQKVALVLPSTYLFENMRRNLSGTGVNLSEIFISYGLNLLYFLLSLVYFYRSYSYAKKTGSLIKNY